LRYKLYRCFTENDATLLEINPLILTKENQLVAGDCKMTLDDAAAFRHDWPLQTEVNFVTINEKGDTATIANGAGLAMATVDAAYDAGLQPANFLDIGGGASVETLLNAFKRILEYPKVKVIIINIFAGITRSDEVARAIIIAKQQLPILPKLYIRLAGTNQREAHALLNTSHIATEITLEACLQKAKEYIG
jgi:succinyl-CoA synthetase beta subunit